MKQSDMTLQAIEVLIPLLRGETVTQKTDWFELNEANGFNCKSYSKPSVEMAIASQISPSGARAAGIHGVGLLSVGATTSGGFNALAANWEIYARKAIPNIRSRSTAIHGHWLVRCILPNTREEAMKNVRFGLERMDYPL